MAGVAIKIRFFGLILFGIAAVAGFAAPVFAEDAVSQESLLNSIEQARRELDEEKQRITREEAAQEKQLTDATAKQGQLVDEKVDRKFTIAAKEAELEKLQREYETLSQQQDSFKRQLEDIRVICGDAHQKLADLLDTLPVSQSRPQQQKLLGKIESSLQNAGGAHIDIEPVLELIESVLEESRSIAVFTSKIRSARGYEEEVQLLAVGQMLFAYKSLSTGQTAIAAGAEEATGFRWNENIPAWAKRRISNAIENISSKGGGIYSLPLDVTGQLTVDQYKEETFWQKTVAGGPVMIPIGIVAVMALIFIIERFIFLRRQSGGAIETAEEILAACHRGDYQKAEQIAIEKPAVISRVMLACLSRRLEGTAVMEDTVSEATLHELAKTERFLPLIGVLVGVAPLLGLLGTVTGMIKTFDAIAMYGSSQPRLMAAGISEALVTTVAGLMIAIPTLLIHNYLSSRSDKLIADTERFSATLLNLLRDEAVKPAQKDSGARG